MTDYPPIEKVRILLAEHATLRTEIIARIGHAYQMMGFLGITLALLFGTSSSWKTFWIVFIVATIIISWGFWTFVRDMRKCTARIREIELDVNNYAQEDLLVWENLWGGEINGYFGLSRPKPRAYLQNLQPPQRTWRGKAIPQ
jgi:hypothetical protein